MNITLSYLYLAQNKTKLKLAVQIQVSLNLILGQFKIQIGHICQQLNFILIGLTKTLFDLQFINKMIKSYPFQSLKKLGSFQRIRRLKQELNHKYGLLDQSQYYVSMARNDVNLFLFPVLGDVSQLRQGQLKSHYEKCGVRTRKLINENLKQNFSHQIPKQYRKGVVIKRLRTHTSLFPPQKSLFSQHQEVWDLITPQSLPSAYNYVYFKLQQYGYKWRQLNDSQNLKQALVIAIKEDQENITLCFFQTQTPFQNQWIDRMCQQIDRKCQQIDGMCGGVQPPKKQASQPGSSQGNKRKVQQVQIPRISELEVNQIDDMCQNFYQDKLSLTWILIIMMLIALVVESLGSGYAIKERRDWEELNHLQKSLIHGKVTIDKNILQPLIWVSSTLS